MIAARGSLDRQVVAPAIADVAVPGQDRAGDAVRAQASSVDANVRQAAVVDQIKSDRQVRPLGPQRLAGGAEAGKRTRQFRKVRPIDHDGDGQPFDFGTRRACSIHVG